MPDATGMRRMRRIPTRRTPSACPSTRAPSIPPTAVTQRAIEEARREYLAAIARDPAALVPPPALRGGSNTAADVAARRAAVHARRTTGSGGGET